MKLLLYPLFTLLLVLFFEPFTRLSLALAVVLALAWQSNTRVAFVSAFVLGLAQDIRSYQTLGVSSLFLVMWVFAVSLVRLQFGARASLVFASGLIAALVARFLSPVGWGWELFFLQGFLTTCLWGISHWWEAREGVYLRG